MSEPQSDDPQGEVERVARAIHEGLGGDGWAYSDYGGFEWDSKRDALNEAARAAIAALRPSAGAGEMSDETAKAMDFFSWEYIKKMTRGPDYDSFQLDAAINYGAALARHIAPGQRASSLTAPAPGVQTEALTAESVFEAIKHGGAGHQDLAESEIGRGVRASNGENTMIHLDIPIWAAVVGAVTVVLTGAAWWFLEQLRKAARGE